MFRLDLSKFPECSQCTLFLLVLMGNSRNPLWEKFCGGVTCWCECEGLFEGSSSKENLLLTIQCLLAERQ